MRLKHVRIIFAALIFTLFLALFIGGEGIASALSPIVTRTQLLPSAILFFTGGGVLAAGFILIIVVTGIFGRVYCSWLCPLGIMQDGFAFIAQRVGKKKYRAFKPNPIIRYGLLFVTLTALLAGMVSVTLLFDPYSIFGRIAGTLFKHAGVFVGKGFVALAQKFGVYSLSKPAMHTVTLATLLLSLGFFLLTTIFALFFGRRYCNLLCPVGTLLSFFSRFSLFAPRINEGACTSCGRCEYVCKGEAISAKDKRVDGGTCVACFNCLDVCPHDAISYMRAMKDEDAPRALVTNPDRRRFLLGTLAGAGAVALARMPVRKAITTRLEGTKSLAYPTPPGSVSFARFMTTCTSCHLCVSACPTRVLSPKGEMLRPVLDFRKYFGKGYCEFECTTCGDVCPTGAIKQLPLERKKRTQIGTVVFEAPRCIVTITGNHCGACAEHCPTKAVRIPLGEKLPVTDAALCIGCGACENVCPAEPKPAIYVKANARHVTLLHVPGNENGDDTSTPSGSGTVDTNEGFPF